MARVSSSCEAKQELKILAMLRFNCSKSSTRVDSLFVFVTMALLVF
jgi:hypothetical protein